MKILIPLLGVVKGGGLRVLVEVANGLARRGHEVTISAAACANSIPFELHSRVEVNYIDIKIPTRLLRRLISILLLLKDTLTNYDVVVSNYYTTSYIGYFASVITNAKHIYFVQGYEPNFFATNTLSNLLKRLLAIISYKLPCHIVTISGWIREQIKDHTKNVILIINNGVDTKLFSPSSFNKEQMKSNIIMTIACREKRKGLYEFISAVELLWDQRKDIYVMFVTSDPTLVINTKVAHQIYRPASDIDLVRSYQRSRVFVSTSHLEGFGLPPLEAMACGTSVVTTDSGGINEYAINGENCLIVPVGDVEAIYNAVNTLINDNEFRMRLERGGMRTASKYTWDLMVDKFEMELLKVCEKTL